MLTASMKSLYEKISQLQENKKMRNYLYKDHAESIKQKHFKVVWDTLQYLQEEKILNYDYNHGFKKIQNKIFFFHKMQV